MTDSARGEQTEDDEYTIYIRKPSLLEVSWPIDHQSSQHVLFWSKLDKLTTRCKPELEGGDLIEEVFHLLIHRQNKIILKSGKSFDFTPWSLTS